MKTVYSRPKSMKDVRMHYCPGCGHSIVHKLIAQVIDELDIRGRTILIGPVGCTVLIYDYIDVDGSEAAHGRAQAVATGMKRALPDQVVLAYQGDGDLAAIGTAETIHAANRGEKFSVIFVNNAIYGMTGGQMAPTTLIGQKTKTSPYGRDAEEAGNPIRMCEMLTTLEAPDYIERVSVHDVRHIVKTKKAIGKAIRYQLEGRRYGFVEVLSMCPTNWGVSSRDAVRWVEEAMIPCYPLGVFRDRVTEQRRGKSGAGGGGSGAEEPVAQPSGGDGTGKRSHD
jgi:2-oxoglutarate ferredoxin oxidoreductase subunit beta